MHSGSSFIQNKEAALPNLNVQTPIKLKNGDHKAVMQRLTMYNYSSNPQPPKNALLANVFHNNGNNVSKDQ
jgi:hypothetical protein